MRVYLMILLLFLIGFTSCKKEKIEIQESNDPVFTLNGNFNGESIQMVAGDNDAYMHTYTEIINGVQLYSGSITSNGRSVSLGFYNGNIDMPAVNITDVMGSFLPEMAESGNSSLTIQASNYMSIQGVQEVEWLVNGISAGSGDLTIDQPGKYEVCASLLYSDQTSKTVCNEIIVGYAIHANAELVATTLNGYVSASVVPVLGTVQHVQWYLDNTEIGTGNNLDYQIGNNTKELSCVITFTNGVQRTKRVIVDGFQPHKNVADFTISEQTQVYSYLQDYKMLVTYMHNGIEFRSDLVDNSQALIELYDVSYFGKNANGKDVYKLSFNINVELGKVGGSNIYPFEFQTVFGIELE